LTRKKVAMIDSRTKKRVQSTLAVQVPPVRLEHAAISLDRLLEIVISHVLAVFSSAFPILVWQIYHRFLGWVISWEVRIETSEIPMLALSFFLSRTFFSVLFTKLRKNGHDLLWSSHLLFVMRSVVNNSMDSFD